MDEASEVIDAVGRAPEGALPYIVALGAFVLAGWVVHVVANRSDRQ